MELNVLMFIGLPASTLGKVSAIFMILAFGYLYIRAMEHLFKNVQISSNSRLIWSIFMSVLPMIAPSIYLATHLIRPID